MQGINNQGTINILIDSAVKQKLNLHLGQTYEARVFSVSEDGKVIIKIGGNEIIAESKVRLQPGQKILVEVKDNTNGLILLQIKNNLILSAKSQINLLRESIINNLLSQNLPIKEENIVISQGLIKYNLRVSSENIQKVLNGIVTAGYQNGLSDNNIVDSGALLFAKGLPLTKETIELASFLKHDKGQVINNISELDNEIDNTIDTIIKNLQNYKGEKDIPKNSKAVLKEVLANLPIELDQESFKALLNPQQTSLEKIKIAKETRSVGELRGEKETLTKENLLNKLDLKTREANIGNVTNKQITDKVDDNRSVLKGEEQIRSLNLEGLRENLKVLTEVKDLLAKAFLNLNPKEIDSDTLTLELKHVARYMVEGEKSLGGELQEKFKGSIKELMSKILLDNLLLKPENINDKTGTENPLASSLKEQLGKLEGNFNEINKHFDAVKLFNTGINESAKDNINNYYLLSLPTVVAGEKFENKVYFWSQGNKKRKIDPENMRIVLCLNTQGLGLLKIDLTIAKRDIYAGIEVTNPQVKVFIEEESSALVDQLASHKYRLKTINCTLKKEEDITPLPSQLPESFTALDLRI